MTRPGSVRRMDFISERRLARLHSPLRNFELVEQVIEHRRDPLTGRRSIVLRGRRDYVKKYVQSDEPLLAETAERTRQGCPFCPEKAQTSTPKFPSTLVPEGTIRVGEARTFPSLFAHAEFNAVTVVANSHYLRPADLTSKILSDALEASIRYLRIVNEKNPEAKYGAILMNCLSPAGSTVVHPHMQALVSDQAFNMLAEVDSKAREYWKRTGSSYWKDLLTNERARSERYLGSLGTSEWITAFCPIGPEEVWGIVPSATDLTRLSADAVATLADGFSRVLKYYDDASIRSFNVVVFSSPFGEDSQHGAVVLRAASRYGFQNHNVNDIWGLRFFLDESEVFESPEAVATDLSKYFT